MEMEETNAADDAWKMNPRNSMKKAGLFFFLLMLFELPVSVLIAMVQSVFPAGYSTTISILMTQGYLLLGAILYLIITGQHFVVDLQVKKYRISTFFLSLVVLITASPMATWLNVFSQLFAKNQTSGAIYQVTQNVPMFFGIVIIGCLPGFIEETLYRGIMFTAFRKRSVLTGIIVSALSFGLMHMNFNQILYAIYLGVIFALIVEATGSIVSTMILHMLFNAVNTSYVYILPKMYEWLGRYSQEYADMDIEAVFEHTPSNTNLFLMLVVLAPFAIGGIVLTILLLKAIAGINKRPFTWAYLRDREKGVEKNGPVTIFLILGWAFCIVIAVMNMLGG